MQFQQLVWEIDEDNHKDFLENELAVLNFFFDWHMNCLMILPVIDSLAEEFEGKIFFGKVNIGECESLAEKWNIKKVPSIIIFRKGEMIDRIDSISNEEVLRERICCLV